MQYADVQEVWGADFDSKARRNKSKSARSSGNPGGRPRGAAPVCSLLEHDLRVLDEGYMSPQAPMWQDHLQDSSVLDSVDSVERRRPMPKATYAEATDQEAERTSTAMTRGETLLPTMAAHTSDAMLLDVCVYTLSGLLLIVVLNQFVELGRLLATAAV
jgi:hypothetical protein